MPDRCFYNLPVNLETFPFTPRTAKYVRIVGHGNRMNSWNSYTEVKIQTGSGGQIITLAPAHDAYVRDGANADITHGITDSMMLVTKVNPTATTGNNRETYLLFDAAGVSGTINSVELKVYGKVDLTTVPSIPVGVFPVTNTTWTENALTWNNKPASGAAALASATVTNAAFSYVTWDITNYVRSEMLAGRTKIALAMKSQTSADPRILWNSSEAGSNPPQLVITTAAPLARAVAPIETAVGSVLKLTLSSYPNPFNESSTITFSLPVAGRTQLSVYDMMGKQVAVLVNAHLLAGYHRTTFASNQLPAGTYLLKMVHNGKVVTKKLLKK